VDRFRKIFQLDVCIPTFEALPNLHQTYPFSNNVQKIAKSTTTSEFNKMALIGTINTTSHAIAVYLALPRGIEMIGYIFSCILNK